MGSFIFQWPYSANEVFVTGTFDDWGKTVRLEKKGDVFEKEVELPSADEKVYYKFVVDGLWTTDSSAREENDGANNINNVLFPEDIKKASQPDFESATLTAAVMAGVTPDSTTAALVADVPKESDSKNATVSSAAPDSTATQLAKDAPLETSGAVPGTFLETPAREPEQLSVNPIAASSGLGNPVKLKPGEPVPPSSTFSPNTVESTATTDKEGYEKDASYPVVPGLGPEATKPVQAFAVPDVTTDLIPESRLPLNPKVCDSADPITVQSAAPEATTAVLAAQVPLESEKKKKKQTNGEAPADEVPDVVKQSISDAHRDPGAAANAEAVEEKKAVEEELQKKVEPKETAGPAGAPTASEVPDVVKASLRKAHEEPEAAANSEAVEGKKLVEDELQFKVPTAESAGQPAPTTTAETALTAPAAPVSQPTVTTGVREAQTSEVSTPEVTTPEVTTPEVSTPENQTTSAAADSTKQDAKGEPRKKNRIGCFFSRLFRGRPR
ncbi:hypothetical protein VTN77DRAFT_9618 [Rasamsonia byssochlamydoides]|uniref:uncharacterized protein n=1 Tax=Rasamsonia byssochlamydoides TaxID=89139 RepID=UPI0037431327